MLLYLVQEECWDFFHRLLKARANEFYDKCSDKDREIEYGSVLNCENKVHDDRKIIWDYPQILRPNKLKHNSMLQIRKSASQCAE